MRRYRFLKRDDVYEALNKLRASFLAAKDTSEVESIINAILTHDERMKIGRRILIAQLLLDGHTFDSIKQVLKVGKNTVAAVERNLAKNPLGFRLISKREEKVERIYSDKAFQTRGGSKMIFKKREYTGFKRKDVKR